MGALVVLLLATAFIGDRCAWGLAPGAPPNPFQLPPFGVVAPGSTGPPRLPTPAVGPTAFGNTPGRTTLPQPFNPGNPGPGASSTSNIQVSGSCGTAANSVTTNGVTTSRQFQFCPAIPVGSQLRSSILSGNVQATANVLVASSDVNGLAAGLKVPPGVTLTKSLVDRDGDPDVVTLKGFALASLTDSSNTQINKLVDVMLKAILPPDLHNFDQTTSKSVPVGCSLKLTSTSTSPANSVQVTTNQKCRTIKVKPFKMQQELRATLKDRAIMNAVVAADADTSARRRNLMCIDCRPAASYVCSFCWPKAVCRSVFWCRSSGR